MDLNQAAGSRLEPKHNGAPSAPVLVIAAESLHWRRRVGPLAWTALQHLALSSHHTDRGWEVAVGVRDIAVGLGVAKDTAARAVSVLVDTGLVTRGRVQTPQGPRRSGYLLHLPPHIRLIAEPHNGYRAAGTASAGQPSEARSSRRLSGRSDLMRASSPGEALVRLGDRREMA